MLTKAIEVGSGRVATSSDQSHVAAISDHDDENDARLKKLSRPRVGPKAKGRRALDWNLGGERRKIEKSGGKVSRKWIIIFSLSLSRFGRRSRFAFPTSYPRLWNAFLL